MAEGAPEKVETTRYVGIDLGSHNTVVASSSTTEPFVITLDTNDLSNRGTPSVIGFDPRQILVGEAAESKMTSRPKQFVANLLASLGSEAAARMAKLPCGYADGSLGPFEFDGKDLMIKAPHLLALYLEKVISFGRRDASKVELCVAVADSMTDSELQDVFDALQLVGGARVVRHASAVKLAYVHKERAALLEAPRCVLFVDVGFAHSTACLVGFSAEEGEVVTSADFPDAVCSAPCGVSSFLDAMLAHSVSVVEQKHSRKVSPDSKQATRLRNAMTKALKDLSIGPDAQVNLECFFPEDDIDIAICITRAQLQEFIADDVKGIGALISAAMEKAGKDWDAVTNVEVIGGGSRVVAVQEALRAQVPEHLVLGAGLDSSSCVAVGSTYFSAASTPDVGRAASVRATAPVEGQPAELGVGETDAWLKQVHGQEVKRLQCENEFEAYIYKVKSWLSGPDKDLVAAAAPEVDKWLLWFEDAQADDTDLAAFEAKFTEAKDFMAEKCAAYFTKVEERAAEKEKEMDAAAEKERQRRKELGMDYDKDERTMPKSERFRLAESNKVEGSEMLKAGKFDDAIRRFKKAVDHISRPEVAQNMSPEEKEQADKIKTGCYLNMSLCYSKAAAQVESDKDRNAAEPYYKKAKTSLDDCLDIGESIKARFRRANVWEKLGDIDKAMEDIKAALKVDPEDADLLKSKARFEKVKDKQKADQKKVYGKMFG